MSKTSDNQGYWEWLSIHQNPDSEGDVKEPTEANPDCLPESAGLWQHNDQESKEKIIKDVRAIYGVLSKKEKQICDLIIRKKNYREIESISGIPIATVSRIIKKLRKKFEIVKQNPD